MKANLNPRNMADIERLTLTGGGKMLDLSQFQVQVMLEFLIGDDREDEFNEYFNERVATLVHAALNMNARERLLGNN